MVRGTSIGRRLPTSAPLSKFFSTSSGGGGRGRGGGLPFHSDFSAPSPGKNQDTESPKPDQDELTQPSVSPPGLGHGRGRPLSSFSSRSSFISFIADIGRGRGGPGSSHPPESEPRPTRPPIGAPPDSRTLPETILSTVNGSGRGLPSVKPVPKAPVVEENRHKRASEGRPIGSTQQRFRPGEGSAPAKPRLTSEEARRNALEILSRKDVSVSGDGGGRGRGRGGRGRGREGRRRLHLPEEKEDEGGSGVFLGNDADGEALAKKVGPELMAKLDEGFDEMSDKVLPSPIDDVFFDAFDTNCMIEFEPEYLVEFDNPDIDEKPPMSLQEALEKMKPFLMAYEGIKSQEEWEQAVNELMERVPLLKEIVDHYSGPDRVTAKQQQEELERVAKTLPGKAPTSVKRFADRAVLSLQSNPGWGWDKKCQFMDKFVREVSEHYK